MTENEAISRIKDHMEIHRLKEPRAIYITVALSMAITALKEVQQYREIGTVEECRKAVEKQKAKEIIIRNWNPTRCPTCNYELSTSLGDGYYKHPIFLERCPNCGQAIRWKESEEE